MIEIENNSSIGPQNLELDIQGEAGVVHVTVRDGDTGEEVIGMFLEDPKIADELLGDVKTAIEEAF